jgi:hypothetical protein
MKLLTSNLVTLIYGSVKAYLKSKYQITLRGPITKYRVQGVITILTWIYNMGSEEFKDTASYELNLLQATGRELPDSYDGLAEFARKISEVSELQFGGEPMIPTRDMHENIISYNRKLGANPANPQCHMITDSFQQTMKRVYMINGELNLMTPNMLIEGIYDYAQRMQEQSALMQSNPLVHQSRLHKISTGSTAKRNDHQSVQGISAKRQKVETTTSYGEKPLCHVCGRNH